MAYSMTTVFGNEICVTPELRKNEVQLSGYAGANGVTSMDLGHRGYPVTVYGVAKYTASTYAAARYGLITALNTTDNYFRGTAEEDWTYAPDGTYYNLKYLSMKIVPYRSGNQVKDFHWNGSECWCEFVVQFHSLSDSTT